MTMRGRARLLAVGTLVLCLVEVRGEHAHARYEIGQVVGDAGGRPPASDEVVLQRHLRQTGHAVVLAPDDAPILSSFRKSASEVVHKFEKAEALALASMHGDILGKRVLLPTPEFGSDDLMVRGEALIVAALLVTVVVLMIYGQRGMALTAAVLLYLYALATIRLALKWVFVHNDFKYPMFVSMIHFKAVAAMCFFLRLHETASEEKSIFQFSLDRIKQVLPLTVALAACILADNTALTYCSVTFVEIVGCTGCLTTAAAAVVMGLPFDSRLLWPMLLVAVGCLLCSLGDIQFSAMGFVLCFGANCLKSVKVCLQSSLLSPAGDGQKWNLIELLFMVSLGGSWLMALCTLLVEGAEPCRVMLTLSTGKFWSLTASLGASCVCAMILSCAQLFVVKRLGPAGAALVSQVKTVLACVGGMTVFGEPLTYLQLLGFIAVLLGAFVYSRMEEHFATETRAKLLDSLKVLSRRRNDALTVGPKV